MQIEPLELLALKKLAIISGALAQSLKNQSAAREQRALTQVLIDVVNRAEIENAATAPAGRPMSADLHEYHSLPGVKGGKLKGPMAKTPSGFLTALRSHRAVAGAGSYGAAMVWVDDYGRYRCHFMRSHITLSDETFNAKRDVRGWLISWLPKQSEAAL